MILEQVANVADIWHMQHQTTLNLLRFILIALGILVSAQCHASVAGGFMSSSPNQILYLRLTQNGTKLDGSMQIVDAGANLPQGFSVSQFNIRGMASGKTISFRADGFLGMRSALFDGTYQNQSMTIHFAASNGQLLNLIFKRTSAQVWNQKVAIFETKQSKVAEARRLYLARVVYLQQTKSDYDAEVRRYADDKAELIQDKEFCAKALAAQGRALADFTAGQKVLDKAKQDAELARANAKSVPKPSDDLSAGAYSQADRRYTQAQNAIYTADNHVYEVENELNTAQNNLKFAGMAATNAATKLKQDESDISAAANRANKDLAILRQLIPQPKKAKTKAVR